MDMRQKRERISFGEGEVSFLSFPDISLNMRIQNIVSYMEFDAITGSSFLPRSNFEYFRDCPCERIASFCPWVLYFSLFPVVHRLIYKNGNCGN